VAYLLRTWLEAFFGVLNECEGHGFFSPKPKVAQVRNVRS